MTRNEYTLLTSQIDRVMADLIDLDMRLAEGCADTPGGTDEPIIGFSEMRRIKHEMANRARAIRAEKH